MVVTEARSFSLSWDSALQDTAMGERPSEREQANENRAVDQTNLAGANGFGFELEGEKNPLRIQERNKNDRHAVERPAC
jgi:hypothetical protein